MEKVDVQKYSENGLGALMESVGETFLTIGEILNEMKAMKMHRLYGYERWVEFMEDKIGIQSARAAQILNVYKTYVDYYDACREDLVRVGYDKLVALLRIVKAKPHKEFIKHMEAAEGMSLGELKQYIEKELGDKEKPLVPEEVYTEQVMQRVSEFVNVSNKKSLMFKLALYLDGVDLDEFAKIVHAKHKRFTEEVRSPASSDGGTDAAE